MSWADLLLLREALEREAQARAKALYEQESLLGHSAEATTLSQRNAMPRLEIKNWQTPATFYPVQELSNFRLVRKTYPAGLYDYFGLDGFGFYLVGESIGITALEEFRDGAWQEWMVDDPVHWVAMRAYAEAASGHVVCGGLGLGLVVHALVGNLAVTRITVVERSSVVVDMVGPLLPSDSRIHIIRGDIAHVLPLLHPVWPDWFIVDIWTFRGLVEKMRLLVSEVLPLAESIKAYFPGAKLLFHGYPSLGDYHLGQKGPVHAE